MKLDFSKNSGNFELLIFTIYYLLMFTLGRYDDFKQPIIWGGGFVTFALSTPFVYRNFKLIPKEALWLVALWFWSLTGGLVAINMEGYLHYLRMIAQMILVIIYFGTICRKTTLLNIFIGSMIIPPLFIFGDMLFFKPTVSNSTIDISLEYSTQRIFGLADDPNAFGIMCCIGIWASLYLLLQTKKKRVWNIPIFAIIAVLFYAIVLSASRSAFLVTAIIIVSWIYFCLSAFFSVKGIRLFIICFLTTAILFCFNWIFANTFLGVRSTRALEQTSEETRVQLLFFGLELFLQSPLIGHGLAQFVELSPTHHYAHNDLIELLATTGLPGACLYYLIYATSFSKLCHSLRYFKNTKTYYDIIMTLILLAILLASGMFNANFASMECSFWIAILLGKLYHFKSQEFCNVRNNSSIQ